MILSICSDLLEMVRADRYCIVIIEKYSGLYLKMKNEDSREESMNSHFTLQKA